MRALTVIIPTYNEEDNIDELLQLVQWANEIIVIDSFSTDKTIEIAQQYNIKLLQRKYTGPADQKNWAIPQASHTWVLMLDADERPTPKLTKEIQDFLTGTEEDYAAFWIGRKSYFMGQAIKYSGWQDDKVIRLFKRDVCRYNNKQVHEEIETTEKVGKLQHSLEHYTYKNLNHFLDKMRRYAKWSALDYAPKTTKVTLFHLWGKPLFRFFKHYIIKRGFLDGKAGFIISIIMAWGVFLRYTFLKEMHLQSKKNQ
ncbi:MAG: glycosyltransferase family 2 protein [Aureispira sp.]|nr:glycosyltransferase family 2 protein [Aureispira sp.]